MKAISGYLDNGHFTPFEVVILPKRVSAVLVFNDPAAEEGRLERMAFLQEFHALGKAAAGEEMPDFPKVKLSRGPVDLSDEEGKP